MAVFVRPATWSYDLELFRSATNDEGRLEAMLAAIALEDEGLWVVESNERPTAFVHAAIEGRVVRMVCLFVGHGVSAADAFPLLLGRLKQEYAARADRLEADVEAIDGVDSAALRAAGLRRNGATWTGPLGA